MSAWDEALRLHESSGEKLVVTKRTNYPKSYTLKDDEFKQLLKAAQGNNAQLTVRSDKDDKLVAVLDPRDIQASLLKMKPSLQHGEGYDYWVCNIPQQAFYRARGQK